MFVEQILAGESHANSWDEETTWQLKKEKTLRLTKSSYGIFNGVELEIWLFGSGHLYYHSRVGIYGWSGGKYLG